MEKTDRVDLVYAIDQLIKLLPDDELWKILDFIAKSVAINHIAIKESALYPKE